MAKKRRYQSVRSRENEAVGMAKSMMKYGSAAGAPPMKERHASMISDDRSAPANLPQRIMDTNWPDANYNNMGYVDDLFYGVQRQIKEDNNDFGRVMKPKKY